MRQQLLKHILTYMHVEAIYFRENPPHRTIPAAHQDAEWIKVSEKTQPAKQRGLCSSNQGRLTFCKACGQRAMCVYMNYHSSVSKEISCELDDQSSIPEKSTETFLFTTTQNGSEPTDSHIRREVRVLSLWLYVAEV